MARSPSRRQCPGASDVPFGGADFGVDGFEPYRQVGDGHRITGPIDLVEQIQFLFFQTKEFIMAVHRTYTPPALPLVVRIALFIALGVVGVLSNSDVSHAEKINPRPGKIVTNQNPIACYRCYDDPTGLGSGSRFERIDATVQRGGFRFGEGGPFTVTNSVIRLKQPTSGTNLPVGAEARAAHDVLYERVTAIGFTMVPVAGKYTNGGGFSSERNAARITYRRTMVEDSSEGYDDKADDTFYDWAVATRVGRGFRCWGNCRASTITVREWTNAAITKHALNVAGAIVPTNFTIDELIAENSGTAPLIRIIAPSSAPKGAYLGTLTIKRCRLRVPAGTKMVVTESGHATVRLGPGCLAP
jgi:hypothetical protein